jgi:predicted RNase H-like HicB family nuclease
MTEILFIVENDQESGYVAKALSHGIFTQAETVEELRSVVRDAVQCHFEDDSRPHYIRLHFVHDEVLSA